MSAPARTCRTGCIRHPLHAGGCLRAPVRVVRCTSCDGIGHDPDGTTCVDCLGTGLPR